MYKGSVFVCQRQIAGFYLFIYVFIYLFTVLFLLKSELQFHPNRAVTTVTPHFLFSQSNNEETSNLKVLQVQSDPYS